MATHNFQIFDESMTDVMTDANYQTDSQRTNGVIPGVADPLLHNKLYRQCSVMAFAIAQTIVARGYSASDSDPAALTSAIQKAFAFSVNGDKPNSSGAITTGKPLDAWPVGSIFMTMSSSNPSSLLGGGTWQKIEGKYLLASSSSFTAGTDYGSMTKTLVANNIPAHTHTFTTASNGAHTHTTSGTAASAGAHTHTVSTVSAGAHTHTVSTVSAGAHTHSFTTGSAGAHTHTTSGTAASAGAHTHTRGSMNITGSFGIDDRSKALTPTGAFSLDESQTYWCGASDYSSGYKMEFDASNGWTGATSSTGAHTHTTSGTAASAGAHTHTGTTASDGAHTHTGTAASNGAHTHTGTAASNGAHTHTTSGTAASAGAHTHTGTTNSTGSGTAFDVKPLSIAVNVWRRTA